MVIEYERHHGYEREPGQQRFSREVVVWQSEGSVKKEIEAINNGIRDIALSYSMHCEAQVPNTISEVKIPLLPPTHFDISESKDWMDVWAFRHSKKH